ncbi:MAG: replication initiation protein [Desulfatirhabdiaceae bacterium]
MLNLTPKEPARPIIKTPQELVHIKHKISLLQYKYWVLMLRAYREVYEETGSSMGDEQYCYLPMKRLSEHLGYEPKTADIERDLEAIRIEPIIFNVLEKDKQKAKTGRGFISEWYVSSNRVGVIFPAVIRQAVEQLDSRQSIFHLLNWSIFNSFTGKYEAIIYKLCKDYVGTGKTKYMPLETFRQYMGVQAHEYPDFKRLNQWVISGPVKRINESAVSDITIKPEFKRETRKVVGLWFHVASKKQTIMDFGDDPAFRFAKVTIALAQQRKYLDEKGAELVELCIQRANEYGEKQEAQGKQVDYGAIYRKSIEENWGEEYQSRKVREAEKVLAKSKHQEIESTAQQQNRLSELEKEYRKHLWHMKIKALTPEERHAHAMAWLQTEKGRGQDHDYDPETTNFKFATNKANFNQTYLLQVIPTPAFEVEAFTVWLQKEKHIDPQKIGVTS